MTTTPVRPPVPGPLQENRKGIDVVGAKHDVNPRRFRHNRVAVLLGKASPDGDLKGGVHPLDGGEAAKVSVELVGRVLAHGAGVDHHHVRASRIHDHIGSAALRLRCHHSRRLEQSGHALGIVDIHLAPEGPDDVGARRTRGSGSRCDQWSYEGHEARFYVSLTPAGVPSRCGVT